VLHSAGELESNVSKNIDKRRIYIDIVEDIVYSVNTQYAGNTVGFKKLSLRMAIRKADREGWLAEHMFILGAHGPDGRVTYFAGAFPSGCGKTSTAMIPGETIVGDDLAYLRKIDGEVRAANVECGIFGIIRNVNEEDDPLIWKSITNPGEVIFSNVLVSEGKPRWLSDGREEPDRGVNFAGEWFEGRTDGEGNEIPLAHPNARYTIRLSMLENLDDRADDPQGVPLGGVIYGGRDSDTWVPVQQSFDWAHGVITMGASLESLTTATTLGQRGVRAFQPMSNLDFVSIPLGKYLQNHLDFVKDIENAPLVFAVNYYIRGPEGGYLNSMQDKYVWLKWMERRVHGEMEGVRTPTGAIPRYSELRELFQRVLERTYTSEDYVKQFMLRIPENIHKIDRIENIYRTKVDDTPQAFFDMLEAQRRRLNAVRKEHGDYVSPFDLI
jgi:phosphoenolpyruvate carboxykinase (GTP)